MTILCCGEALIDMIPTPTELGCDGFVPHSGGAVFNTAVALGRLGARAGLLTGLSTDMFGQQLAAALQASHVDTSLAIKSDRPTTLAFVQLTDGHASYSFFDENSAGCMLSPDDMPALPPEISTLFFGGISLACEPCADAYAALLAREGENRAVMIDPNVRPGFISDEARYRSRLEAMIAQADILKVSDEDLNWIVPTPQSLREKIEEMLNKGPSLVILTQGGEGATGYLSNGTEITVPARQVQIVDTVGAGDTFNAGVMAWFFEEGKMTRAALRSLSDDAVQAALANGASAAAITVSRAGANPPWADEK
ncbi:MAG: carbohydrate kinase [Rhodobacteraceae bacterium]|nr:carbohydrate kinase [Paracoccaceae bacterium]